MSTENKNQTEDNKTNEKVAEVTAKLDDLSVNNNKPGDENEAAEQKGPRRGGPRGFRGGRGRGRGGRMGGGRTFAPRPPYEEQVKQIEEDLASKKVIEKGVTGFVKWFSVRGRYGFIARENSKDEKEDFFVHQNSILKSSTNKFYLRTLDDDEPVVFDIVEGKKGLEAANVTGPDGENVRGSRYARSLLRHWNFRGARRGGARGGARGGPRGKKTEEGEENAEKQGESGDGEVRGQRRVRRARGKLQPKEGDAPESDKKAEGDAPEGEKKKPRRNHKKGPKKAAENGGQPAAEPVQA